MIHERPRCMGCGDEVSPADLIFAPPCGSTAGHDKCGSACWHPLCLMDHRERMERAAAIHVTFQQVLARMFAELLDEED